MKRTTQGLAAGLLLWLPTLGAAEADVAVFGKAFDPVGSQLVAGVSARLGNRPNVRLAGPEEDSRVQIRIVPEDPDGDGQRTVYAAAWTTYLPRHQGGPFFWTQVIGLCSRDHIPQCAEDLARKTTEVLSSRQAVVQKAMPSEVP